MGEGRPPPSSNKRALQVHLLEFIVAPTVTMLLLLGVHDVGHGVKILGQIGVATFARNILAALSVFCQPRGAEPQLQERRNHIASACTHSHRHTQPCHLLPGIEKRGGGQGARPFGHDLCRF